MTEIKHTPGPWKVFSTVHGKVIGIGQVTGEGIADCGFGVWGGGDAESNANARLIAAAPELLVALQRTEKMLARFQSAGEAPHPDDLISVVRAAIAKATAVPGPPRDGGTP